MSAALLDAFGLGVRLGGRAILADVSLALRPGEVTVLVGPNGAGKSTLMACLAGLRRPDIGEVRLDGRVLRTVPDRERAKTIGFLPQTPEIAWDVDVETLVGLGRLPHRGGFGLSGADRVAIDRALEAVDMTAFRSRIATTLSGGERARALIARVLAGEPRLLLADEPLAGLDPAHQFDVCDLFRRIAADGPAVLLTLHDLPLAARIADRVLVLDRGRLIADGVPQVLTRELIARVYQIAARCGPSAEGWQVQLDGRLPAPVAKAV